jgi:Sulfotransferase family
LPSLLEVSAAMKRSSPVFIVGEARSGTSILYRTLQKHSSFRPKQTNLAETNIFVHLRRTFMFNQEYPETLRQFMLGDMRRYQEFLRSIAVLRVVSALWVGPNYLLRDRVTWLWYANLNHLLLRSYFFHAAAARGCSRLVEKTPTNTSNIAKLAKTFPRARFLYVHRHPVDVFGSYRRRAKADPNATWANIAPADFCQTWRASTERVLGWLNRGNGNLRLVRYEMFTEEPDAEFERICAFLDEPFEPEAVEERHPDLTRWRGDPLLWGPVVRQTRTWADHVTAAEAEYLQQRLRPVMDALGYEPYPVS